MAKAPGKPAIYELADKFRQNCLVEGTSLIWPSQPSWSVENINRLDQLILGNPDLGDRDFFAKLRDQLAGASDDIHRIAADVLAFYFLYPMTNPGPNKKREGLDTVISWRLKDDQTDLSLVSKAFGEDGLGKAGTAYLLQRPWQIQFFLQLAESVRSGQVNASDAKAVQRIADSLASKIQFSRSARNVALHLLYPESYEHTASDRQKKLMVEGFKDRAGDYADLDDALMRIRQSFVSEGQENFDFYDPGIRAQWEVPEEEEEPPAGGKRVWIFQANPKYYDIDSAVRELPEQTWLVTQFRNEIEVGDSVYLWKSGPDAGIIAVASVLTEPAEIFAAEGENKYNRDPERFAGKKLRVALHVEKVLSNPITRAQLKSHPTLSSLTILSFANASNFRVRNDQAQALEDLLAKDQGPVKRVWIEKTLVAGRPDRESGDRALGRALWSPQRDKRGADIYRWMRETKPGDIVLHLTDNKAITGTSIVAGKFEDADGVSGTDWASGPCYLVKLRDFTNLDPELSREEFFAEPFRERLLSLLDSGVTLFYNRELNLNQGSYLTPAPPELLEIFNEAYMKKANHPLVILDNPPRAVEETRLQPDYSLSQLAAETGIAESLLSSWIRAVERKGQAILYGPPGTGKTFVAERIARHLISGGDGFSELVQFHPSYAYEDFIQGIRPKAAKNGSLDYSIVPGRFLDFCQKASSRKKRCVLIIDEINRANLSRVFGELMYLLEYRDREMPLSGGGRLRVPDNIRVIGTMNTADRSIALVDHALRRRFAFVALHPDYEVLRKFHSTATFNVEGLISTLKRLNAQINDHHYEVGITFFLTANLRDQIEAIWTMEIEPYLEEYFFDQRDTVDSFRWDRVSASIL
jgi:hypothetical protein